MTKSHVPSGPCPLRGQQVGLRLLAHQRAPDPDAHGESECATREHVVPVVAVVHHARGHHEHAQQRAPDVPQPRHARVTRQPEVQEPEPRDCEARVPAGRAFQALVQHQFIGLGTLRDGDVQSERVCGLAPRQEVRPRVAQKQLKAVCEHAIDAQRECERYAADVEQMELRRHPVGARQARERPALVPRHEAVASDGAPAGQHQHRQREREEQALHRGHRFVRDEALVDGRVVGADLARESRRHVEF